MPFFDIMLRTCKSTESPPKPSRKAHIMMFMEMFLFGIAHTLLTPFVSSIIPEKMLSQNSGDNPKMLNKGENAVLKISKKCVLSSIELITENKTTNPPIITIVFMEFFMLIPRTSPKLSIFTIPRRCGIIF